MQMLSEGQKVQFGSYPATADDVKEPLIWRVLEVRDGKALLFSQRVIDAFPYDAKQYVVTWEDCQLRKFLNSAVLKELFSNEEQQILYPVTNANPDNKHFFAKGGEPSAGGNNTEDILFLLNTEEIEKYFPDQRKARAKATEHAGKKIKAENDNGFVPYWLRGPGMRGNLAVYVNSSGNVDHTGYHVESADIGLRPAVWVDITKTFAAELIRNCSASNSVTDVKTTADTKNEKPEETARSRKAGRIISIMTGCIGIAMPLVLILSGIITGSISFIMCIVLIAIGFAAAIVGIIAGCRSKCRTGLALAIVAMIFCLLMTGILYYARYSYIWEII